MCACVCVCVCVCVVERERERERERELRFINTLIVIMLVSSELVQRRTAIRFSSFSLTSCNADTLTDHRGTDRSDTEVAWEGN